MFCRKPYTNQHKKIQRWNKIKLDNNKKEIENIKIKKIKLDKKNIEQWK